MSLGKLVSYALLALAAAALSLALLAQLDLFTLGPGEAERAELNERWARFEQTSAPLPAPANAELASFDQRLKAEESGLIDLSISLADLDPIERELLDQLLHWLESVPVESLGGNDGLPLLRVVGFALSIEPPVELPLPELVAASTRIVRDGNLLGALTGHMLANKLLRLAHARGFSRADFAAIQKPTSEDLARAFVADAKAAESFALDLTEKESGALFDGIQRSGNQFFREAIRQAVLEYSETVWAARGNLDELERIELVEPPSKLALYLAGIFRDPGPISANLHSHLSGSLAASVRHWRQLGEEWDASLDLLPGAED